jgi:hypothetical protein
LTFLGLSLPQGKFNIRISELASSHGQLITKLLWLGLGLFSIFGFLATYAALIAVRL